MSELKLIRMCEVEEEKVEWLWYPYIPYGKLTLVRGNPGEGKTMFILNLIAGLSRGTEEISGDPDPKNSLYQTAEDGMADTVKPRLIAANADCKRIFSIDESSGLLSFQDERIEQAIIQTDAKILVLDPLQAYIGESVDMNRANEVRPAFRALASVAAKTGCAVVIVEHMNKMQDKKVLLRGLGSVDITGAARSILYLFKKEEDSDEVYLMHVKSNLAEKGKTLKFRIRDGRMLFCGEASQAEAERLRNEADEETQSKLQTAIDVLNLSLRNEEIPAKAIYETLEAAGISKRTVEEAKRLLRVRSVRHSDGWYWTLANQDAETEPVIH